MNSLLILLVACLAFAASIALAACGGSEPMTMTPTTEARTVSVITYVPGAAWDATKPATEQALGPHLQYVGAEFAGQRLLANGLYTTSPRGLYLVEGDGAAAAAFIADDPGLESQVLNHEATESWSVLIDNLAGPLGAGDVAFVLRYRPGASWIAGRPLAEQDVNAHLGYIEEHFGADVVVGGGPINGGDSGGTYVIKAATLEAAQAFADADPGVATGLFAPTVDGWQLMNAPVR